MALTSGVGSIIFFFLYRRERRSMEKRLSDVDRHFDLAEKTTFENSSRFTFKAAIASGKTVSVTALLEWNSLDDSRKNKIRSQFETEAEIALNRQCSHLDSYPSDDDLESLLSRVASQLANDFDIRRVRVRVVSIDRPKKAGQTFGLYMADDQ